MLLLVAVNQFFLSLDTYLVHVANGTIRAREAIPIWFGVVAGLALLICGVIARRNRHLASIIATVVFVGSVVVGVLGFYFHLRRGMLPNAPLGERLTLELLIWAPPVLAPFAFAGVGLVGMSAAWAERPTDSGLLHFGRFSLQLPFSKTRAYLFYIALGILVAVLSATLDHARHWNGGWLWLPTIVGVFSLFVTTALALIPKPSKTDIYTYAATMIVLLVTGVIGAYFHIRADLTAQNTFVLERFLRGAPVLSPLLYSNMGLTGLVVLLTGEE